MAQLKNLKAILKSRNLTQKQLAKAINVNESTISYIINGVNGVSLTVVILIADYLQVSIDFLVGRVNNDSF